MGGIPTIMHSPIGVIIRFLITWAEPVQPLDFDALVLCSAAVGIGATSVVRLKLLI